MKTKFFTFIAFLVLCVTAMTFQSCTAEKYTVWTDNISVYEFENAFGLTIEDGMYVKTPISLSDWEKLSQYLEKDGRHSWDEATIKKWLISIGFGEAESTKEAAWFALNDHGLLASRSGGSIYFLLK